MSISWYWLPLTFNTDKAHDEYLFKWNPAFTLKILFSHHDHHYRRRKLVYPQLYS